MGAHRRPRTPPVCWKCNQVGHIQRYCPNDRSQHNVKVAEELGDEGAFAAPRDLPGMGKCLIDSGASSHNIMTPQRECLVNYCKCDVPEKVGLGDGRIMEAEGVGNVHVTQWRSWLLQYGGAL